MKIIDNNAKPDCLYLEFLLLLTVIDFRISETKTAPFDKKWNNPETGYR